MFAKQLKLSSFALLFSVINLVLYHLAFYRFVLSTIEANTFNGILLVVNLTVVAILLNATVFYAGLYSMRTVGRWLLVLFYNTNAVAVYFISTYGVMIDRSMIGNIFNTNYEEASSFFSFTLILYVLLLGVAPSYLLLKMRWIRPRFPRFISHVGIALLVLLALVYANSSSWLWIDKNSKKLGALVMPWSYVVNTVRYYSYEHEKNKKQIQLPDAAIQDSTKSVVVVVIGESARKANFSLYGYARNTNPLLSQIANLHVYNAESSATYTTAGVKSILDHKKTGKLYEILPNYLFRNGVEVIWRSNNWGEPTVRIKHYLTKKDIQQQYPCDDSNYDAVLLSGLKDEILASDKNKVFVVLHTSTSHGPTYYKKYPERFSQFTPVCQSVELAKCSQEELINAYDNTIVYTDYLLTTLIHELQDLKEYHTAMIFVSDHGESLGEKNLYMHGVPMSIAPKEQFEIPFIAWASSDSIKFKDSDMLSQYNVFHTVLDLLSVKSPVYDETMSIIKK